MRQLPKAKSVTANTSNNEHPIEKKPENPLNTPFLRQHRKERNTSKLRIDWRSFCSHTRRNPMQDNAETVTGGLQYFVYYLHTITF